MKLTEFFLLQAFIVLSFAKKLSINEVYDDLGNLIGGEMKENENQQENLSE